MSELRTNTITASDGTSPVILTKQHAPKMFLGSGSADAVVVDSLNVSSSVYSGTGSYIYNTTNAFIYEIDLGCGVGGCCSGAAGAVRLSGSNTNASSVNIQTELLSDGSNSNLRHHLIACGELA